jgi:hypothetical protein
MRSAFGVPSSANVIKVYINCQRSDASPRPSHATKSSASISPSRRPRGTPTDSSRQKEPDLARPVIAGSRGVRYPSGRDFYVVPLPAATS